MPEPFSNTLHSLEAHRGRGAIFILLIGAALLVAWGLWFQTARVPVLAISQSAQVETPSPRVFAQIGGTVIRSPLRLGQTVARGDLLFELDAREETLAERGEMATLKALEAEKVRLESAIAALQTALFEIRQASAAAGERMQAEVRAAEARLRLAEAEEAQAGELATTGLVSQAELLRARAEAQERRADLEARYSALLEQETGARSEVSDRLAALQKSQQLLEELNGEIRSSGAETERLGLRLQRYRHLAPTSGRVAALADLPPGASVPANEWLVTIEPDAEATIIARFPARDVAGRLRPGLKARLSSPVFPWPQFDSATATVARVGSVVTDGLLTAELTIEDGPTPFPLTPGGPLRIDVELERTSPWELVLRAAGRRLSALQDPAPHP